MHAMPLINSAKEIMAILTLSISGGYFFSLKFSLMLYIILKIKMLCNLLCMRARLRLQCKKLSAAHQPAPRFKKA